MTRSERGLANRESEQIGLFRPSMISAALVELGEVLHGHRNLQVSRSQRLLQNLSRSSKQPLGFDIVSCSPQVQQSQIIQLTADIGMIRVDRKHTRLHSR